MHRGCVFVGCEFSSPVQVQLSCSTKHNTYQYVGNRSRVKVSFHINLHIGKTMNNVQLVYNHIAIHLEYVIHSLSVDLFKNKI